MILNSSAGVPIHDVYVSRWFIFYSIFVAVFVAFFYVKLMDWFAYQVAWISVIVVGSGLIGGGYLCWNVR